MNDLVLVIVFSLAGGLLGLSGGALLLTRKKHVVLAKYATAFAAGALLAAAFADLLPDAFSGDDEEHFIAAFVLIGIMTFFILESLIHWFHNHSVPPKRLTHPVVPLIIIGDTLHNFIDGIAIAAGFLVSPMTGVVVTLAIAAHEIPQEIGDFGLLLHNGMRRRNILIVNVLSAIVSTVSAVIFYIIGTSSELPLEPVLAIVGGFFIYIAASDIIPSIHSEENRRVVVQSLILMLSVLAVGLMIKFLHGFIG